MALVLCHVTYIYILIWNSLTLLISRKKFLRLFFIPNLSPATSTLIWSCVFNIQITLALFDEFIKNSFQEIILYYNVVWWWWDKRVRLRRTANKITTGLVQINSLTKYLTLQRKAQRKSYILTSQIFIRYKVLNPNPKFLSITLLYVHNRQVVLLNFRSNDPNYVRGSNNVRSLLVNTAVTIEIVNFENDNLDLYIQKCCFDQISKRDWFTVRPFI